LSNRGNLAFTLLGFQKKNMESDDTAQENAEHRGETRRLRLRSLHRCHEGLRYEARAKYLKRTFSAGHGSPPPTECRLLSFGFVGTRFRDKKRGEKKFAERAGKWGIAPKIK
jgi:hypothetical protein